MTNKVITYSILIVWTFHSLCLALPLPSDGGGSGWHHGKGTWNPNDASNWLFGTGSSAYPPVTAATTSPTHLEQPFFASTPSFHYGVPDSPQDSTAGTHHSRQPSPVHPQRSRSPTPPRHDYGMPGHTTGTHGHTQSSGQHNVPLPQYGQEWGNFFAGNLSQGYAGHDPYASYGTLPQSTHHIESGSHQNPASSTYWNPIPAYQDHSLSGLSDTYHQPGTPLTFGGILEGGVGGGGGYSVASSPTYHDSFQPDSHQHHETTQSTADVPPSAFNDRLLRGITWKNIEALMSPDELGKTTAGLVRKAVRERTDGTLSYASWAQFPESTKRAIYERFLNRYGGSSSGSGQHQGSGTASLALAVEDQRAPKWAAKVPEGFRRRIIEKIQTVLGHKSDSAARDMLKQNFVTNDTGVQLLDSLHDDNAFRSLVLDLDRRRKLNNQLSSRHYM